MDIDSPADLFSRAMDRLYGDTMRDYAEYMDGVSLSFLYAIEDGRLPKLMKGLRTANEDHRYIEVDKFCRTCNVEGFMEAVNLARTKPRVPKPTMQRLMDTHSAIVNLLTEAGVAKDREVDRLTNELLHRLRGLAQ